MATTPNSPSGLQSDLERDAGSLKETLKHEADAAGEALHEARNAAQRKASELASEAKAGAMRQAEGAKQYATDSLQTFASAIREAGDKLAESDQGMAAGFVRQAASSLERVATSLGQRRFSDMVDDVRSFGRQNPGAFIAGTVLAGLAIGRFVRSSAEHEDGEAMHPGTGRMASGGRRGGRSISTEPGITGMNPTGALNPMSSPSGASQGSQKRASGSTASGRSTSTGAGGPTGSGSTRPGGPH